MSMTKPVLMAALFASLAVGHCAHAAEPAPSTDTTPAAPAFPDREARVWQMGLTRSDRLQHATFSFSAGLMIGLTAEEPLAAAGGAMAFGLAKELWDARTGRFDVLDLVADALGAAGAFASTVTLTR